MKKQLLALSVGAILLTGGLKALDEKEQDCIKSIIGANGGTWQDRIDFVKANCPECPEVDKIIAAMKAAGNIVEAESIGEEVEKDEELLKDIIKDEIPAVIEEVNKTEGIDLSTHSNIEDTSKRAEQKDIEKIKKLVTEEMKL
ncbi:hypothetical protein KC460_04495 [Candidatus Dependentiae bacterium]|nr:hypothetical protein [Candidatus Dependentiae bacterium]